MYMVVILIQNALQWRDFIEDEYKGHKKRGLWVQSYPKYYTVFCQFLCLFINRIILLVTKREISKALYLYGILDEYNSLLDVQILIICGQWDK